MSDDEPRYRQTDSVSQFGIPDTLRYERLSTPRASYIVIRNGVKVAVCSKTERGTWAATGMRSRVTTEGHPSRADAATAIIVLLDHP